MQEEWMFDWNSNIAAVWRPKSAKLRAVKRLDDISLDRLLGIDRQKKALITNTESFLAGGPANNALLWGSRGTGKSSLIKALLNAYAEQGLRVLEIDKDDLIDLTEIVDHIRELPQRFVVYCDDLSFEANETGFKHLKSVLEGSLELPPENVLLYATSNRRHLIPEQMKENLETQIVDGELHYGDSIEEKLSLADRFGLWLSFHPNTMEQYLAIIDDLFDNLNVSTEACHEAAKRFAHSRGSKSGRTAQQFFREYQARTS